MPVITIFGGNFCKTDLVVAELLFRAEYKLVSDKELVLEASKVSGLAAREIERAFSARTSVFNKFTHEKERSISCLKLALSQTLTQDDLLMTGFATQLIPKEMNHVLRVCLIADMKFRISEGTKEGGIP